MIYTEEQAPEIWCSEVRHTTEGLPSANRVDDISCGHDQFGSGYNCCIATRCAHWRWFDPALEHSWTGEGDGWAENVTMEGQFSRPTPDRRGYCGLSGKPEHAE